MFSLNGRSNATVLDGLKITGGSGYDGAGIRNQDSSPVLTTVTISGNTVSYGGGMHNNNSSPMMYNSIILGNSSGESSFDYAHSFVQSEADNTNGNIDATGVLLADVFVTPISPAALSPGGDFHLKPLSPAIDAGSTVYWTNGTYAHAQLGNKALFDYLGGDWGTIKDLAGISRKVGEIDLGAYAFFDFAVTFDADGGTPEPPKQFLHTAVNDKVTEPPTPVKTGFVFDGWYNGSAAWFSSQAA